MRGGCSSVGFKNESSGCESCGSRKTFCSSYLMSWSICMYGNRYDGDHEIGQIRAIGLKGYLGIR